MAVRAELKETPAMPPAGRGLFQRFLDWIERNGNRLWDPVTLFSVIALIILIASAVTASMGVSAINPANGQEVAAVNLLNKNGVIKILTGMVGNFSSFPPLGLVLVTMIGVGLAETTGLLSVLMKRGVMAAPAKLVIPAIVFAGIMGNSAGDAAYIVLPPLAAMLMAAMGYNPLIGLVLAYASVSGGFSANLLLTMIDTLLAGFTQTGAAMIDKDFVVNPAVNWYFLMASTLLLVGVSTWVTYRFAIPRLGKYTGEAIKIDELTAGERKGMRWAGWATLVYIAMVLVMTVPANAWLRNAETGSLVNQAPFMSALVPIVTLLFFIPALFYGMGAQTIRSDKDVAEQLGKSMASMGSYIVLAFVSAQMIAFFTWSNLGPIIAIKGAEFLKEIGLTGLPLLIGFIFIAGLINMLLASASAKWAILAPVFVPMFMLVGYHPAFTQMAFRIGDSVTNPITPMMPYFAMLLSYARQYDKKAGMGTLISALLPYSIFFAVFWIALFIVWYYLGLPLGPDGPIHMPMP